MLVLSRKLNEQIWIDGRIEVTVLRVVGQRVMLGISAPREVSIRRGELTPELPIRQVCEPVGAAG